MIIANITDNITSAIYHTIATITITNKRAISFTIIPVNTTSIIITIVITIAVSNTIFFFY